MTIEVTGDRIAESLSHLLLLQELSFHPVESTFTLTREHAIGSIYGNHGRGTVLQ